MVKVEYSSNNSGGSWWLTDEDWKALEEAGWKVDWVKDRKDQLFGGGSSGRWLGALATSASIEVEDPVEAIRQFEQITGQDTSDEGCNCCGPPHSFYWETADGKSHGVSGGEVVACLYGADLPKSYREAIEQLKGK